MPTTEELIARINKTLDDIAIDTPGLFDDLDVPKLFFVFKNRLEVLKDLEEELERRVGELGPAPIFKDKKSKDPHLSWIYRKRHYRSLTLERLRAAITAHRMALAILDANYVLRKGKVDIPPDALKRSDLQKVKAVERPVKLGRIDILPYLAYSGDVLRLLGQRGIEIREHFKLIKGKLREEGTVRKEKFRIEVEYWENGKLKKEKLDLPVDADIEGELRKKYGKRFRWRVLSYVKTVGVLINNHYTVDNLALAYSTLNPKEGVRLLALDIFRYYFLTSEKERENVSIYPGIRSCIDCHYSLFDIPFKERADFKVGFGSLLLIRKCEIEKMLVRRRSDITRLPNYVLGGVILYGISSFTEEEVANLLEIDIGELREGIRKFVVSGLHKVVFSDVSKFEKFMPKSEKAKKFLELLQG
ncbi:hypothetical protein A3L04_04710 [Thermococcus chitonophagus]|uniref:Conserved protein n=1 Tax=Thermococcus chitonophagus TaxID=54262 RepID=A0A160VX47_9EURY|nr:DUF530 family protein [Thermococcus chitonophagus]ASJ16426.1 hypothetical protein A3L04_04710 [Thermococcus chitonophagus]CUX78581.1 Conserved protein [Thermococcus chitonophagus]